MGLPLIAGLAAGGTVLGSLFGKNKTKTIDPYSQLRDQYKTYLSGRLGQQTPYEYNDAFTIQQPEVEKAAESSILGKLKSGPNNVADYSQATKQYSDAMKASREQTYADERKKTSDMYNRLGLVSSTPGLEAQSELNRRQATEANVFDSELAYKNLDRNLQAQGLDIQEMNNMLSQASVLGQTQRQGEQWSKQMSLEDIVRKIQEEEAFAQLTGSLIGGNPPQYLQEPNFWAKIGDISSSVLPYLAMGAGGGAGATDPTKLAHSILGY